MASNDSGLDNLSPILSLAAFQILEENFVSSALTSLQATVNDEMSFAFDILLSGYGGSSHCIVAGSLAEGIGNVNALLGFPCDLDLLEVKTSLRAVDKEEEIDFTSNTTQFLVEYSDSNPGFAKLALLKEGTDLEGIILSSSKTLCCIQNGIKYLSSSEIKISTKIAILNKLVCNLVSESDMLDFIQISGPATTIYFRGPKLRIGLLNGFRMKNFDIVFAIPFPSWPSVAVEWVNRIRQHDWPTAEIIRTVLGHGSLLVPKGNRSVSVTNLDWAFTFSHVEPILTRSMNDIMIKTYVILKCLKRFLLEDEFGEQLTSYIMKTALFWEAEERDKQEWQPHKLLHCVRNCLIRIESWFRSNFAPHYFIRSLNLIHHVGKPVERLKFLEVFRNLIETIDIVFQNIPPFLHSLQRKNMHKTVGAYYEEKCFDIDTLLDSAQSQTVIRNLLFVFSSAGLSLMFGKYFNRNVSLDKYRLELFRRRVSDIFQHRFPTPIKQAVCAILMLKKVSLELQYLHTLPTNRNMWVYRKKRLLRDLQKAFRATYPLLILGNCVQYMFHFIYLNDQKMMEHWVDVIKKRLTCDCLLRINLSNPGLLYQEMLQSVLMGLSALDDRKTIVIANDIHITEFELNFLPPIVKLELECRLNTNQETSPFFKASNEYVVSVDSEVLFHFISFCFYHMKDRNIKKLAFLRSLEASCMRPSTNWRHIAWNLLGYCRTEMGLYEDALKAYYESLNYRETNTDLRAFSKATPWHVAILLKKCLWREWSQTT